MTSVIYLDDELSSEDEKKVKVEKKQKANVQGAIARVYAEVEEVKSLHEKQVKEQTRELNDKDKSLSVVKKELESFKTKNAVLNKRYDSKKNVTFELRLKLADALEEWDELKKKIIPIEEENNELKGKISLLETDNGRLTREISHQKTELQIQSSQLSRKEEELHRLDNELLNVKEVKNGEIAQLVSALVVSNQEKTNVNKKLDEIELEKIEHSKTTENLKAEYAEVLEKYKILQIELSRLTKLHLKVRDRMITQQNHFRDLQKKQMEILECNEAMLTGALDTSDAEIGLSVPLLSESAAISSLGASNEEVFSSIIPGRFVHDEEIKQLTSDFSNEPFHAQLIREAVTNGAPNNELVKHGTYSCRLCLESKEYLHETRLANHILKKRNFSSENDQNDWTKNLNEKLESLGKGKANLRKFSECKVMKLLLQRVINATHKFDLEKINALLDACSTASATAHAYRNQTKRFSETERMAIYGHMADLWSEDLMIAAEDDAQGSV